MATERLSALLSSEANAPGSVQGTVNSYEAMFESGTAEDRKATYMNVIQTYYNLATPFYVRLLAFLGPVSPTGRPIHHHRSTALPRPQNRPPLLASDDPPAALTLCSLPPTHLGMGCTSLFCSAGAALGPTAAAARHSPAAGSLRPAR